MLRESPGEVFAHSLPNRPISQWESLEHHLAAVGKCAANFAAVFGWAEAARVAGLLHDIGKVSAEFQAYIRTPREDGAYTRGPDHSTAGAREAFRLYGGFLGRMLAYAVAGHHSGLADIESLDDRLNPSRPLERYDGWEAHAGRLPPPAALKNTKTFNESAAKGFERAFLIRMLFSCLVDADFLETEKFYARAEGEQISRGGFLDLRTLQARLTAHMQELADRGKTDPSEVNVLRAEVLETATGRAILPPGLFTFTVPTGGGKTLASLSFALEHARQHGLRRVVYVIPFTSIIEQTAQVFRNALGTERDILEHHASFDWERQPGGLSDDGEGRDGLAKLRRAAENWDAPIVVTTAVQFFESLYAARPSRCRKLHNLAGSVIVLDEAQTLPIKLLRPCMAALNELARNYGASVVLCTATQPALRRMDGFQTGFEIGDGRELAPEPRRLYDRLKRVRIEHLADPIDDAVIVERFERQDQMLCIVNSRKHAKRLFESVRHLDGAAHLSTWMCPRHRRAVLAEVKDRLKAGEPVRLVSTSLIEAGVDIDFPEVWRAVAGLDAIAQSAGRANREGRRPELGRVVVFEPVDDRPPPELKGYWQAARTALRKHGVDELLGLDAVRDYFQELYWSKGEKALDAVEVAGLRGVLPAIAEGQAGLRFPFKSIAEGFRMIEDAMEPVVVPWDDDAKALLDTIAIKDRPYSSDLRRLQQYTVSIPPEQRLRWLGLGVLKPVHQGLGEALLQFDDIEHYDKNTGVRLDDLYHRSAESNLM